MPMASTAAASKASTILTPDHHGALQVLANADVALEPAKPERFLHITLATPEAVIAAAIQPSWLEILGTFVAAGLLTLPIVFLATGKVVRPLLRMNTAVRAYQHGQQLDTLPVENTDEIGELARAFSGLVQNLASSEARHRAIIETMQDAHIVADSQRRTPTANTLPARGKPDRPGPAISQSSMPTATPK